MNFQTIKLDNEEYITSKNSTYDYFVSKFMNENGYVVIPPNELHERLPNITTIKILDLFGYINEEPIPTIITACGPSMWTLDPYSDDTKNDLKYIWNPCAIESPYIEINIDPTPILVSNQYGYWIPRNSLIGYYFKIDIGDPNSDAFKICKKWLNELSEYIRDEKMPLNELLSDFTIRMSNGVNQNNTLVLFAVGAYPIKITSDHNNNAEVVFKCVLAVNKD